jgi:hypothetical protein
MTMRKRPGAIAPLLRAALALGIVVVAIVLLTARMPPRSPDFVWRGPAGALSPGPHAAAALRDVARVLRSDYRLPLPSRLVARAYASPDAFARGLVLHAMLDPPRAAHLAGFASGVALPGALLLRERDGDPTPDWIRLVAHELTHVAQIELAGGEAPAARWLGEGMAEWVAYGVVARTIPGALDGHRELARPDFCAAVAAGRLELGAPGAPETFVHALRHGALPAYRVAFVLVDDLIGRAGFASVRAYFGSFRESMDAEANFVAAFSMPVAAFERHLIDHAGTVCATPARSV